MPTVHSLPDAAQRKANKAAEILRKARADATKSRGYQSAPARAKIRSDFIARNNGMVPHDWQVDFGEALLLGLDCTMIAGTGAGKTMPFVMPLFVESDKMIIIISPLNALEVDQAVRFRKMGLSAVAVNGDTYSNAIHKEIEEFKHRVIITSPDMCLKHDKFRHLLSTPAFAKRIAAFVIDEAHCITQWGPSFRPEYAELGTLRAFVPLKVPFLVASATLPPTVLAAVHKSVHINPETSYMVNLGNDRPNIAWFVQHMKAAKTDLEALEFLAEDEAQTMVFFDDISLSMDALKHIRERMVRTRRGEIAIYHSKRSKRSKRIIMEKFRSGEIKILLTTEAAGMGCDIPHVEQVVQFLVPDSLSIWMQRAGRAGRNFLIAARAILLVQPSMFQELKAKKGEPPPKDGDPVAFKKTVEEGLRAWIETEGCRRNVVDKYFDNCTDRSAPTGICCDNCLRKTSPNHPLLLIHGRKVQAVERPMSPSSDDEDSPSQTPGENGKRMMRPASEIPNRREEHLKDARALLTSWRNNACATIYRRCVWGPEALLADTLITKFATWARLQTCADLIDVAGWSPTHTARHGDEILKMLADLDAKHKVSHAAQIRARADARKAATETRAKIKKVITAIRSRQTTAAKGLRPPKPRASRAKPKKSPKKKKLPLSDVSNHGPITPLSLNHAGAFTPLSHPHRPLQLPPSEYPPPFAPHGHIDFNNLAGSSPGPSNFGRHQTPLTSRRNFAGQNPAHTSLEAHPIHPFNSNHLGRSHPSHPVQSPHPITGHSAPHPLETPLQRSRFDSYVDDPYVPPAPNFFHDEFGTPLPALTFPPLTPSSFYGQHIPPQFLPGHSSSPYTTPSSNHLPPPSHDPNHGHYMLEGDYYNNSNY